MIGTALQKLSSWYARWFAQAPSAPPKYLDDGRENLEYIIWGIEPIDAPVDSVNRPCGTQLAWHVDALGIDEKEMDGK